MTDAAGAIPVGADLLNPMQPTPAPTPTPVSAATARPVLRSPAPAASAPAEKLPDVTAPAAAPVASGFVPYDQYVKTSAAPAPAPEEHNSFVRGFLTSAHQLPELGGATVAFAGDVLKHLGADNVGEAMLDYGLDVYKRHQQDTEDLSKDSDSFSYAIKHPSKLGSWLAYGAGYTGGQAVESLAAMLAGAVAGSEVPGIGNAVGAAVSLVARKTVERAVVKQAEKLMAEKVAKGVAEGAAKRLARRQAAKQVEKELAGKLGGDVAKQAVQGAIGRRVGRAVGAVGAAQGINEMQELGSVYGDAREQARLDGRELTGADLARIGVMATSAAGVDTLADMINLSRFMNGAKLGSKAEGAIKKRMKAGLREMAAGAAREGGTEAAQTVLERVGAGQPVANAEGVQDIVDSAALGVIGGGLAGVGAGLHGQESATPEQQATQEYQQRWQQAKAEMRQREQDPDDDLMSENPELARRAVQGVAEKHGVALDDLESDEPPAQAPPAPAVNQAAPEEAPPDQAAEVPEPAAAQPAPQAEPAATAPTPAVPHPNATPGSLSDAANAIAENQPPQTSVAAAPASEQPTAIKPKQAAFEPVPPPIPPWANPETGELRQPTQNELVHTLASHLEDRYNRAGTMRFNPDLVAEAWGVTKQQVNQARKPALAMANRRIANQRTQERAEQAAHIPDAEGAQGFNEAVAQLDEGPPIANEPDTSAEKSKKPWEMGYEEWADHERATAMQGNQRLRQQYDALQKRIAATKEALTHRMPKEDRVGLQQQLDDDRATMVASAPETLLAPDAPERDITPARYERMLANARKRGDLPTSNAATVQATQGTEALSSGQTGNAAPTVTKAAQEAATSPASAQPEPTPAQQEAGNFRMGHVRLHGLDVSIEIPKGGTRRGTNANGKTWERTLADHYGYIRGTKGADGEHVDTYVGPKAEDPEAPVFVVDQVKPGTDQFDEHKVMLGFANATTARQAYRKNFPKGMNTFGGMRKMTLPEFKEWLASGDMKRPVANGNASTAVTTPAPAQAEAKPTTSAVIRKGDRVRITKGKHEGKTGVVFRAGPSSTGIQLDSGTRVGVSTKAVEAAQTHERKAGDSTRTHTAGTEGTRAVAPSVEESGTIEDFGEKLGGARKDQARSLATDLTDEDIASQPLSKIWPRKEVDDLTDPFAHALAFAARAEIPSKPRSSYKVARWVGQVKTVRQLARDAVEGKLTPEVLQEADGLNNFAAKVKLLQQVAPADWSRVDAVELRPHSYRIVDGKKVPNPHVSVRVDGTTHWLPGKAIDDVMDQATDLVKQAKPAKRMAFEIRRISKNDYYINKKGDKEYRHLKDFKNLEEARDWRLNHHDELVQAWEGVKARDNVTKADMRRAENRARTGPDYRNDEDVTAERFANTFGFRGVEFGNWVRQGKNTKERQGMLNQAYDALMDLAGIIGVPPRALSLNGTLGLGLGSRGHGWASAHFEPGRLVINLTKTRGAGALAHEWFHALDNYFARLRGAPVGDRNKSFVTYRPEPMLVNTSRPGMPPMTRAQLKMRQQAHPTAAIYRDDEWSPDPSHPDGVRPVVEKAFADLVNALDASPMKGRSLSIDKGKADGYWSRIIERAARSFENYVIVKMADQGIENDYLANVSTPEEFKRANTRYPYLLPDEVGPVAEAFDALFSTIETRENENGDVAMFSRAIHSAPVRSTRTVEELDAVANRIRAGWRNAPAIRTVRRFDDLPAALRQKAAKEGVDGKDVSAAWHDGVVWLVADHPALATDAGVERAIFHEVWGHYGLRALFGKDVMRALTRMATAMGGIPGIMRYARRAGIDLEPYRKSFVGRDDLSRGQRQALLLDELAAHIAQNGTPTLKQRLKEYLGAIKAWLRDHGFPGMAQMSDLDLAHVLKQARDVVVDGKPRMPGDTGTAFQRVFHGTPHRGIEKEGFKLNKIGTGEGAQAYGHGIYFAGKREVAEEYRRGLSSEYWSEVQATANDAVDRAGDENLAVDRLRNSAASARASERNGDAARYEAAAEWIEEGRPSREAGQLYRAEIPEDSELLDWDKPLSEQPTAVQKLLRMRVESDAWAGFEVISNAGLTPAQAENPHSFGSRLGSFHTESAAREFMTELTGRRLYSILSRNGGPRAASEALGRIGIPGLRYLDGGSRGKGEGTHNYVIWDENHLNNDVQPLFRAGVAPPGAPKDVVAHLRRVNDWARAATQEWGDNQPRVRVVHDADMLPAAAKTDPRYKRALGFYDGEQVWLVASNLHTRKQALTTLTHEAVGHYGVERIIADELGPDAWDKTEASITAQRQRVREIQRRNRAAGRPVNAGMNRVQRVVAEVEARYGADTPARTFAQETLAVMSEKGVSNLWLDRAITAIRQWLRKIMPGLHLSNAELRQLLVRSDRYLRAQETYRQRVSRVQAHAFDVAPGVHTPAFQRWFGASKTVDDRGQPLVLFHGTAEEFTAFRADRSGEATHHATSGLGFFATQSRVQAQRYAENASGGVPAEEQVMDLYMAIRKPYTMSLDEAQAIETPDQATAVRARLEQAGYDGIRMPETGVWIAFSPGQIKSASGNVGTFDASNPDIRFSVPVPVPNDYLNQPPVRITRLTGDEIGGATPAAARRNANEFLRRWLQELARTTGGNTIRNERSGFDIGVTVKRVKHGYQGRGRAQVQVVAAMQQMLERAALIDARAHEPANADFEQVHTLVAPVEIAGQLFAVKLTVKERKDGTFGLYHHEALEMKTPVGNPQTAPQKGTRPGPATGDVVSIRQMLTAFKGENAKYVPRESGSPGAGNFSLSADSLETADKVVQASDDDRTSVEKVKDWLAGKFEDVKPALLGTLQLRHLLELMEDHKPLAGAQVYANVMQRMDADRNQLLQGAPDADEHPKDMLRKGVANIQKDWQKWAFSKSWLGLGRKTETAEETESVMHDATRMGMDPDKGFERLHIEDGKGQFVPWTKEILRDRIKHLRTIARSNAGDDKSMLMDEVKHLRGIPKREKLREELWPALKRRYDALPEEAKQTYREVRDWYQQHADATEKALIARIEAMDLPETYRRSMADRIRLRFEMNRREGVYFPLDRNGDYWISYSDMDGKQGFLMLESAAELKKAERAIRGRGWTVEGTGRRNKNYRAKDAPSGTFVKEIIQQLQKAGVSEQVQNDIYQTFLKTLPEVSMRKHHIRRKSVPGFSGNAMRAFAKNGFHGSYQLARLRWSQRLQMILEGMKAKVDEYRSADELGNSAEATGTDTAKLDALLGELDKRHEWIMNPTDSQLANKMTSIGFFYFLGASPASALVNLLQGAQVTLPVLAARHGWNKASRVLGSATAQAMRTRGDITKLLKSAGERKAYMELLKRGDIDRTQGHTLAAVAEGNDLASNPQWERVMRGMSWMFHTAEVINRSAAGMAAYRLAVSEGKNFNEAVQYASDIINGTQFDYSNANRPRFMQKGWQKVLLQFKNYSYSMTWVMYRNLYQAFKGESPEVRRTARRTLTGVLGMTGLMAGVVGLPIINLIAFAANAAHAVGGDDDQPWDFMTEFRAWLAEHFGTTAANVIADGTVDQLGVNISGRVSLSDLWFRDADRHLEGTDAYHQLLDALVGPAGSIVKNTFYVGPQYISEGHIWRGVERMMPTFAKNGMKAFRYATQGVNTLRGDPIVPDVSTADDFIQALGFRPTAVAEQQRVNSALMNYNQQVRERRKTLLNAYAMSLRMDDTDARRQALQKIRHFNTEWPPIAITGSTIRQSLRGRARYSQQALHGMPIDKRLQRRLQELVQPAENAAAGT